MRLFKPIYLDREGKKQRTRKFYLDFTTADGIRHKLPLVENRRACEAVSNTIADCISCKVAKMSVEPELQRKLDVLPTRILKKLSAYGLLDNARLEGSKLLTEHLADFENYLLAKGNTTRHCRQTKETLLRTFEACKFRYCSDITAARFLGCVAEAKNSGKKMSQRTANFYIKAGKQFGRWMFQHKRAGESPLSILTCETQTEQQRQRRALEPDEIRRLLETTQAAGRRFKMDGEQRALLYRLAIETGLRASELRSLKVSSFNFDNCTVTVEAAYSKNRRQSTLPLRKETAAIFASFLAGKLPTVQVFNIPDKTAKMLKADLAVAGIDYVDEAGRYADFHSLRHTTGSLLAASGAHPKVAQSIMRHSDINLTMSRYSHIFRGQESEAVEKLPDLSLPSTEAQKAIKSGTDDNPVFDSCLASSLYKQCVLNRTGLDYSGQIPPEKQTEKTAISTTRTAFSAENQAKETNGRYRNRTCDPLIKSQLLYQLS